MPPLGSHEAGLRSPGAQRRHQQGGGPRDEHPHVAQRGLLLQPPRTGDERDTCESHDGDRPARDDQSATIGVTVVCTFAEPFAIVADSRGKTSVALPVVATASASRLVPRNAAMVSAMRLN